jgi:hypothetical protein
VVPGLEGQRPYCPTLEAAVTVQNSAAVGITTAALKEQAL